MRSFSSAKKTTRPTPQRERPRCTHPLSASSVVTPRSSLLSNHLRLTASLTRRHSDELVIIRFHSQIHRSSRSSTRMRINSLDSDLVTRSSFQAYRQVTRCLFTATSVISRHARNAVQESASNKRASRRRPACRRTAMYKRNNWPPSHWQSFCGQRSSRIVLSQGAESAMWSLECATPIKHLPSRPRNILFTTTHRGRSGGRDGRRTGTSGGAGPFGNRRPCGRTGVGFRI